MSRRLSSFFILITLLIPLSTLAAPRCAPTLRFIALFQRPALTGTSSPTYEVTAFERIAGQSDAVVLVGMSGPSSISEFFSANSTRSGAYKVYANNETGESLRTHLRIGSLGDLERPVSPTHRFSFSTDGLTNKRLQVPQADPLETQTQIPSSWIRSERPLVQIFKLKTTDETKSWLGPKTSLEVEIYGDIQNADSQKVLILLTQKFRRLLRREAQVREYFVADISSGEFGETYLRAMKTDFDLQMEIARDGAAVLNFRPSPKSESNLEIAPAGLHLVRLP